VPIFADSNRASIRAIPESVINWGVTPVSGNARALRLTSSTLSAKKNTKVSDELRFDRMVGSVIEVSAMSEGDINIEYSAGSHDLFLQAFVLGQWSRPMEWDKFSGIVVSWTSTSVLTISGGDYTSYFTAGRRIVTGGFQVPENNSYFQIASVAFGAGVTTVTMSTTTAVIEAGNNKSFIQDANDIVIFKNTTIRSGTAAASTFDSNGSNAFASAIAAGQLVVGQTIQVDGFGVATGSFDLSATNPTDGEYLTVFDGLNTTIYEFDNNSSILSGRTAVTIGASAALTAVNLSAAINATRVSGNSAVSATSATTVVTVKNWKKTGGTLAKVAANVVLTAFTGGSTVSGFYTLTGVTSDILTVSPAPATDANAGSIGITIKGSMLRNPDGTGSLPHQAIVPQSFTIETAYNDIGLYQTQRGMRVGDWNINVQSGEIVKGKYSFHGRDTVMATTPLIGTTPYIQQGTTTTEVMNATTNVGALKKNGLALSSALQSIELKGNSSLRDQSAVGNKFPAGIGTGRFNLTGTITAYFQDSVLYSHFINHETIGLSFSVTDIDGNSNFYTIPAIKVTSDSIHPEGIDKDIMEPLDFVAFRDAATGTMLQIDRFSSSKSVAA
jgi:hypothetical protein